MVWSSFSSGSGAWKRGKWKPETKIQDCTQERADCSGFGRGVTLALSRVLPHRRWNYWNSVKTTHDTNVCCGQLGQQGKVERLPPSPHTHAHTPRLANNRDKVRSNPFHVGISIDCGALLFVCFRGTQLAVRFNFRLSLIHPVHSPDNILTGSPSPSLALMNGEHHLSLSCPALG